ncbi:LysR family transcriptional regulator [Hydrogenophaga sp.]|uniref:LysR family transcriptional regulator n=1 Tax=Hydrogenophaga sp. TaxID=1904254 RepID=UPI00263657FA|nr:LysR family transcriptional regulator [Hydrogenophaga sp.]MCW5652183.1 LysR family transcriptional regulator [Hydrogenophaga sp.]
MSPTELNMRLLQVFHEVYRTRSVSRAADELGISQPSISLGLAKLRAHFGDPLFVRTSAGMEPTPYGQQLVTPIRGVLQLLDQTLGTRPAFEPAASDRNFRVCMTDITQTVVLPHLLERLKRDAPNVSLAILRITDVALKGLESGDVDLVVGYVPEPPAGVYQQRLMMRDFVCIASSRHPRVRKTLSLAAYDAERHVVVTASGTGLRRAEEVLAARKVKRQVALEVPDLLGIDAIVANSEFLATVNRPVGQLLARAGHIRVFEHPVKLPSYLVKLHWHERYHLDPGNQWLRRVIAEIMGPSARLI